MQNMQMQNPENSVDVDKLAALIKKFAWASIITDAIYAALNVFLAIACIYLTAVADGENPYHLSCAVGVAGFTLLMISTSIYEESRVLYKKNAVKSSGTWPLFNLYMFGVNYIKLGFVVAELTSSDVDMNGIIMARSPTFIIVITCTVMLVYSIVRATLIYTLARLFTRN